MNKHKKLIITTIIALAIIIPFIGMMYLGYLDTELSTLPKTDILDLTWYSEEGEIKSFPVKQEVDKNQEYTIYAYLPNDCSKVNALFYRSLHQRVVVSIDDEIIYIYDTDETRMFGLANPRKLNIINLPQGIENKKISITISTPYPKYSGYFSDVEIGEATQVVRLMYDKYIGGYIFSIIIMALVICFVLVNFLFLIFKINTKSMIFILLSGLFVGLWLFGDSKLITVYASGFFTNQLKYVSLMVFILLFSLYLRKISVLKYQKIFDIITVISVVNICVQCIFYLANISDYVIFSPLSLIIILIQFLFYVLNCYSKIKNRTKEGKLKLRTIFEFIVVIALFIATLANIILNHIANYNLNNVLGILFLVLIIIVYIKNIISILNKAVESTLYKERFKEAQNYLIQSQMKPHFIFNTLAAIRTLIVSSPKTAYEMTTNFSKYLRANINKIGPGEKVTFAQELDHIKAYLAIELERFKNRLNVEYDIECDDFLIPPLSIEPLVENAVKHGVCKKVKGGTVKISSKEYEDRYVVIVEDDGVGFDVDILDSDTKAGSVGLKYIIIRLKELSEADFNIESIKGEGTKATVTIFKKVNK